MHLQGLSKLQYLWLYNTNITDVGLVHLERMNQLYMLRLGRTKVTDKGVKKLQQALRTYRLDGRAKGQFRKEGEKVELRRGAVESAATGKGR